MPQCSPLSGQVLLLCHRVSSPEECGLATFWLLIVSATCSNYKAEAEALIVALNLIKSTPNSKTMKFVLLSDAKSVLQALNNQGHQSFPKVNQLLAEVASVSARFSNEQADSLAKEGSAMNQIETDMSLEESKTQIRTAIYQRWIENHPNYSKTDAYHRLNREGQTIIFVFVQDTIVLKNTCIQNSKLVQAPTVHVAISLKQLSTSSRTAHFMQN